MPPRTLKTPPARPKKGDPKEGDGFIGESMQSMDRLQEAVRRVIAAVPDVGSRAADLGRALDLDSALAWQIHALAGKPDLLMTSRVVPKPGAMERFLKAAARAVPQELAQSAKAAYEAFEQTVTDLAGDRDTFDAMLTLQRPGDSAGLRRVRRAAQRADAAVWGVSCRCAIHTTVFHQRPTGEQDCHVIRGRIGIQRLHAEAMVSISASTRTWGGSFLQPAPGSKITIDEADLIEDACSRPLPQIERILAADGTHRDYLTMNGLGKKSEATVFWRNKSLAVPNLSTPPHGISAACLVPTELMLLYLVIPRGWTGVDNVKSWVTPDSTRSSPPNPAVKFRLPFEGGAKYLGNSLNAFHSAAAPQYADLMRSEFARSGWGEDDFEIFRCEVQYPVLHSAVHLCVE